MENRTKSDSSDRLTYRLLGIIVVLLGVILYVKFDRVAATLYGMDNPKARGELLTTCLSIIGGGAIIYGLYLNNKRLREQSRQNDIATYSNNDKRFGEAIGYLNNENVGIAIGGVYSLFQLAKEDKRYVPIVANMFCEYVTNNPDGTPLHNSKVNDIILRLMLYSDYYVFASEKLVFHHTYVEYINPIEKCGNIEFRECRLKNICFKECAELVFHNCILIECKLLDCRTYRLNKGEFSNVIVNNDIYPMSARFTPDSISKCIISSSKGIQRLILECDKIDDQVVIASRNIDELRLKVSNLYKYNKETTPDVKILVRTDSKHNVRIYGDERLVEIVDYNGTVQRFV